MMIRFFILILLQSLFAAHSIAFAYNIDQKQISVSGLSSGAYMAGQVHVALSKTFMGAGLIAGGPFYCAQGDLNRAQTECMSARNGPPKLNPLMQITKRLSAKGEIDSIQNLKATRLYFFSGQNDEVVVPTVVQTNLGFYEKIGVPATHIQFVNNLPAGHAYPTENYGNSCETRRTTPFISDCGYDTAGALLNYIYGDLKKKSAAKETNFHLFSQSQYSEADVDAISLNETAVAYVPQKCQDGEPCRLHIVFHGCKQTFDHVRDQFYKHTGYNEWAETNNIIIIYPQAVSNYKINNPNGCWDWYGYTGENYHTKRGPQIAAIQKLIVNFSKPGMKL